MPELEPTAPSGRSPRRRFSRRPARSIAAVAAVSLVGGAVAVMAGGATPASATDINKSFNVHCTIPVAGSQAYTAKVTATAPDNVHPGDSVSLQNFAMTIGLNSATTDALQTLAATTLQGSITAGASVTNTTPSALSIVATVPTTAVPQDVNPDGTAPAFSITATGVSPTATVSSTGSVVITASTIAAYFDPQDETGRSVLPVAKRNIPCTFDAGQDLTLVSVLSTSPTPSPSPSPSPSPTPIAEPTPRVPSVVLTADPTSLTPGQSSVLAARVDGTPGQVGDQYTVTGIDADGDSVGCTTNPCSIQFSKPGVYTLTAVIRIGPVHGTSNPVTIGVKVSEGPTPSVAPSQSPTPTVKVTPSPSPTPTPTGAAPTFSVSPNPAQFGQTITVSGTKCVAPSNAQAPTVTVNTLSGDAITPHTAVPNSGGD